MLARSLMGVLNGWTTSCEKPLWTVLCRRKANVYQTTLLGRLLKHRAARNVPRRQREDSLIATTTGTHRACCTSHFISRMFRSNATGKHMFCNQRYQASSFLHRYRFCLIKSEWTIHTSVFTHSATNGLAIAPAL